MFVWLENNMLNVAYNQNDIPQNIQVIEIDTGDITPVPPPHAYITISNGQIIRKTSQETFQWFQQQKLQQLDNYVTSLLQPTDYIVVKLSEAYLSNNNTLETLQSKYITQLQYRQSIRDWNDKMKQTINNSTTIEQLNAIVIQYQGA